MSEPLRVAIADPPYVGQANRRYRDHPDYAGEVDHAALIARLVAEYPDGWALCLSSPSLQTILALCPPDVRVLAWVKPWCTWLPTQRVAFAWEPVIVRGGRGKQQGRQTVRDWVSANATKRRGVVGAKPEAFCFWLFEVLGLLPGDRLDDLFPGSGAVGVAWATWQRQLWWCA